MPLNGCSYYITLADRPDRGTKFEAWAKKPGMPWSVATSDIAPFVAHRQPRGGDYGCWLSHITVMRMALDAGKEYALIFEDDAIPTAAAKSQQMWDLIYAQVVRIMTEKPNWEIIGLGGIPLTWWHTARKVDTDIIQTPFLEAHAYLASRRFMSRMIASEFTGTFDSELARRSSSESYIVRNELFEQDPTCGSNLSLSLVIPFRRGYKKAVWAWTRRFETPCRNVTVFLTACVVAFLAHPSIYSHMSQRAGVRWASRGFVYFLVAIYIINEYGQDCHSKRYRRY